MNKSTFVAFVTGVAIGSVATFYLVKQKYEKFADEEIAKFKEDYSAAYSNKSAALSDRFSKGTEETKKASDSFKKLSDEVAKVNPDIMDYARKLKENEYTKYTEIPKEEPKKVQQPTDGPYAISPDEYGRLYDYSQISLTFYKDGILTDEGDMIVDNWETTVGTDFEDYFDEYEKDVVYICNDARKCYYEICRDQRNYIDVIGENPYKAEIE